MMTSDRKPCEWCGQDLPNHPVQDLFCSEFCHMDWLDAQEVETGDQPCKVTDAPEET